MYFLTLLYRIVMLLLYTAFLQLNFMIQNLTRFTKNLVCTTKKQLLIYQTFQKGFIL
jgi:hypothetical protein